MSYQLIYIGVDEVLSVGVVLVFKYGNKNKFDFSKKI